MGGHTVTHGGTTVSVEVEVGAREDSREGEKSENNDGAHKNEGDGSLPPEEGKRGPPGETNAGTTCLGEVANVDCYNGGLVHGSEEMNEGLGEMKVDNE